MPKGAFHSDGRNIRDIFPDLVVEGAVPRHPPFSRCWIWTGKVNRPDCYGECDYQGEYWLVHRLSLSLNLGRYVRRGFHACHTCDVKQCCNPDHLYEGTPQQNAADRAAGVVTLDVAAEIWKTQWSVTDRETARRFRIARSVVLYIRQRSLDELPSLFPLRDDDKVFSSARNGRPLPRDGSRRDAALKAQADATVRRLRRSFSGFVTSPPSVVLFERPRLSRGAGWTYTDKRTKRV